MAADGHSPFNQSSSVKSRILRGALKGIARQERPKIHTIIFSGSVLKSTFSWQELTPAFAKRVVNDCGTKDWVLVLNQLLVLFTGMAGRAGFTGIPESNTFRNRFFDFGHGGYFKTRDGPSDEFMRDKWVPLIESDVDIQRFMDPGLRRLPGASPLGRRLCLPALWHGGRAVPL